MNDHIKRAKSSRTERAIFQQGDQWAGDRDSPASVVILNGISSSTKLII